MADHDIWHRRASWPSDPVGYVFLARAVERVGKAMFGTQWLGNEHSAVAVQAWSGGELQLMAIPRRLARRNVSKLGHPESGKPEQDDNAAVSRQQSVYFEIVRACQTGELATATRPREGGAMSVLPVDIWNTDRWSSRFATCEIDVQRPFQHAWTKDEGAWIFVTSASLDKLLASLPHHRIVSEELPHLSPYLRTMIAVARKVEISPENQVKKESLVTEIYAAWKEEAPLSDHLAQVMATLIREPASQAGRRISKPQKKG